MGKNQASRQAPLLPCTPSAGASNCGAGTDIRIMIPNNFHTYSIRAKNKEPSKGLKIVGKSGVPVGIRTPDLRLRISREPKRRFRVLCESLSSIAYNCHWDKIKSGVPVGIRPPDLRLRMSREPKRRFRVLCESLSSIAYNCHWDKIKSGVPVGIRTPDLRLRRAALYPAELQARMKR